MELFMANIRSQSCRAVFLGVLSQYLEFSDLISPAVRFAQGCLD